MVKLDRDRLAAELAALTSLLGSLPENDYLGRMGLEGRRHEVQQQFDQLADVEERRAKVALYFGGDPVIGSMGVQAGFGTKAVGSFQDLLSKVWGASEGGQASAVRPVKTASNLHITNLVQGSFGFLLEELDQEGEVLFETPLSKAADQVAEYIESFASENDARFSEVIEEMDQRVFQSIRTFFGYVHKGNATFRLVEGDRDQKFDHLAVERAWSRAEESNVDEAEYQVQGKLLGVIPMRRRFEFEPDGGPQIIEGKVGQKFSQRYLERLNNEQFAGRRWRALLYKRLVTKAGRTPAENYTLLDLEEIND